MSRMQRLLPLALLSFASAQFQGNSEFHVTDQATITCSTAGFKCGYNDYEFTSVDATGSGQTTSGGFGGIENLVWSPLDVSTDQLVLDGCSVDYCLVVSLARCIEGNRKHAAGVIGLHSHLLGLQCGMRLCRCIWCPL